MTGGRSSRLAAALALGVVALGAPAAAAGLDLMGGWNDNASQGLRIGKLDVTRDEVRIGRTSSYRVRKIRDSGSGLIFQVTGPAHRRDLFGCGAHGQVTYLVLQPLPPIAGTSQQAILLTFYGGDHVPDLPSLDTDRFVCATHAYGRPPPPAAHAR